MQQKRQHVFKKKNYNCAFFAIPLFILILLGLMTLILTANYQFDLKIAKELAKGLKYEFMKYLTTIYEQLGYTELVVVSIIFLTILLEFWGQKKGKTNCYTFKNKYYLVNGFYFLVLILGLTSYIVAIYGTFYEDGGFGKGIYFRLLADIKYKITALIIIFIYQTTALVTGLIGVKFYLIKKQDFLRSNIELKIIGSFCYLITTYSIIVFIKGATGRPYYYNVIFGDLLNEHPALKTHYLKSGFRYGFDNGNGYIDNIPPEYQYPGGKATGFFNAAKEMPKFDLFGDYAFPSGHINATYYSGSIILLFINYNYKTTGKIKLCYLIGLCHLLLMNFALIIARFHWLSDMAFTFVLSSSMVFLTNKLINKKIRLRLLNNK